MDYIKTSDILDPNQAQPYFGLSLEFHQASTKEALQNICLGLIGSSYSSGEIYVLWGCVRTGAADGAGSGVASVSAGAIFHNGEIYTVPAFTTANIAGKTLFSAISTSYAAFDPSTFSNGAAFNVHQIRQWSITAANSGSLPQIGWQYINDIWHYVGGANALGTSFYHSWTSYSGILGSFPVRFRLSLDRRHVELGGIITGGAQGTIGFYLPDGYRPTRVVTYDNLNILANTSRGVVYAFPDVGNPSLDYGIQLGTGTGTLDINLDGVMIPLD
jgi:hypothetical protein